MITVTRSTDDTDTLRSVLHSINFSEDVLAFSLLETATAFTTTMPSLVLGTVNAFVAMAVDRSVFRERLKDARWFVYAAGAVNPGDGNTATVGLAYVDDSGALIPLGSTTATGATFQKIHVGPFDLFATAPATERIPMLALTAQKNAGANGSLVGWCVWIRFLASKQ